MKRWQYSVAFFAALCILAVYLKLKKLGKKGQLVLIIPYYTRLFLSSRYFETKYTLFRFMNHFKGRNDRVLTYYHDIYDPHCIAMLHILPSIVQTYSVKIVLKLTQNTDIETFGPKSAKFNVVDATIQAQYYQIPINLPLSYDHISETNQGIKNKLYTLSNSILAKYINSPDIIPFIENALKISNIIWDTNTELKAKYNKILSQYENDRVSQTETVEIMKTSHNALTKANFENHYLSGNIYFNSEWFPRVDRIIFLLERLKPYKIDSSPIPQKLKLRFPFDVRLKLTGAKEINLYYSFRSPYSYLILERVYRIAKDNGLKLNIKLVLPSIFRKVTITADKKKYIPFDCARIAQLLGIEYGCIFDVGLDMKYIQLCFRLFLYARFKGKEQELTLELGKYVWAKGIDISKVWAMKKMFADCGGGQLDYNEYMNEYKPRHLENEDYMKEMDSNSDDLFETGNWGVPSVQFGERCVWGQDRLWALSDKYVKVFPNIHND